jgi:hypothetical protein
MTSGATTWLMKDGGKKRAIKQEGQADREK